MTVGYGDFSPKSQLGRVLFIVYAMIAVPTVTFLVQVFVEAADISKYVYNSKAARQRRIQELDTREIHEIKHTITRDSHEFRPLGSPEKVVTSNLADVQRQTNLCPESDIKQETQLQKSCEEVDDERKDEERWRRKSQTDNTRIQWLQAERNNRAKLLQDARKLDHLTRLLISPHLHHEARLLLSLEMGRLDSHYRTLLRKLSQSRSEEGVMIESDRTWMEDTKEAEWLGLTGIERERKFVIEYRECFASLLNEIEILVDGFSPDAAESPPVVESRDSRVPPSACQPTTKQTRRQSSAGGIKWSH